MKSDTLEENFQFFLVAAWDNSSFVRKNSKLQQMFTKMLRISPILD